MQFSCAESHAAHSLQHAVEPPHRAIHAPDLVLLGVLGRLDEEDQRNARTVILIDGIGLADAMHVRLVQLQRHEVYISGVGAHRDNFALSEELTLAELDVAPRSQRQHQDVLAVRVAMPADVVLDVVKAIAKDVGDLAVVECFDARAERFDEVDAGVLVGVAIALVVVSVLREGLAEEDGIVIPWEVLVVVEDGECGVGLLAAEELPTQENAGDLFRFLQGIKELRRRCLNLQRCQRKNGRCLFFCRGCGGWWHHGCLCGCGCVCGRRCGDSHGV
mmetsp:Transcript_22544/g.62898  ORF Transcript_22544/g.62898 Transcript_22544/m.62898 type:complete len:275 (+) Transcript_22544:174-998(+)